MNETPKSEKLKDGDYFLWKNEVHRFHSDAGYGIKTWTDYDPEDGSSLLVNWSNCTGRIELFIGNKPDTEIAQQTTAKDTEIKELRSRLDKYEMPRLNDTYLDNTSRHYNVENPD